MPTICRSSSWVPPIIAPRHLKLEAGFPAILGVLGRPSVLTTSADSASGAGIHPVCLPTRSCGPQVFCNRLVTLSAMSARPISKVTVTAGVQDGLNKGHEHRNGERRQRKAQRGTRGGPIPYVRKCERSGMYVVVRRCHPSITITDRYHVSRVRTRTCFISRLPQILFTDGPSDRVCASSSRPSIDRIGLIQGAPHLRRTFPIWQVRVCLSI